MLSGYNSSFVKTSLNQKATMKKRMLLAVSVIGVAIAYNVTLAYVDKQLQKRDFSGVYNSCHKVWASRGLYEQRSEQNTPKAMQSAFSNGANGAEVDLHFDLASKRFIVSHDHPVKGANGELVYSEKNGEILYLDAFFRQVDANRYFWLDFKNLDNLDDDQTELVIKRLKEITAFDTSFKERLYIEGSNPLVLSKYTDAGFKTILGIHPLKESVFASSFVVNIYKMGFYFNNITALAMPYGKLDDPIFGERTASSLSAVPTFLFHTPDDKELITNLLKIKNIRVMMVGRDLSLNRFKINLCE